MLSAVLESPRAVEVSLAVARAFVRMRHLLVTQEELVRRVEALAEKLDLHDVQLALVFEELQEIRSLMAAPITNAIGFRADT